MAISLSLWEKSLLIFFISLNLFSKELYLKTDKKIDYFEEYTILSEDFENSCAISIDVKGDLEEKILKNLNKIGFLKAINFNFIENERDPFWASYLLKIFSIYAKTENPEIKIFLTGNIKWLQENVEWYFDGVENAKIFSHLLIRIDGGIADFIKIDAPFIISENKKQAEALFFMKYLKEGFYPANFLKVYPENIIPLIKEDLSFALIIPENFKGNVFLPQENFESAVDLKGNKIELKKERDGISFYIENKNSLDLIFLKKPKEMSFSERKEFKREKILNLTEILSKIQILFSMSNNYFSYYKAETETNLNISFGAFTKPYYIKINGNMHFKRGEEELWEWESVEIEGSSFKGKDFPPIPVLMPEKVKINPFYLYPKEYYTYEIIRTSKENVILGFKPKKEFLKKGIPAYFGKIYLKFNFFPEKIERSQINLKGEFLSLEEELFFAEEEGLPILKLYKGKESLNILGGITTVEIETNFKKIEKIQEKYIPEKGKVYFERKEEGWIPSKKFPNRFLTFGIMKMPEEAMPLPLGGISWISLESKNQYSFIFAGILGILNKSYFFKNSSLNFDSFILLYPFPDYPYKNGKKIKTEGVKIRPFALNLTYTSPAFKNLNLQLKTGMSYLHFESTKEKEPSYFLPPSSITYSETISLIYSKKGYKFLISGEIFQRDKDFRFGYEKSEGFTNGKKWGFVLGKDFKILKNFLHFDLSYYKGRDLDRFSNFRSGSFSNLEIEGFPSGSIASNEIFISHLNYNFQFIFSKNLNLGFDFLSNLKEKENYLGIKFSTFFNFPYNFLMQLQGGFGLKGEGKGISIRALFFKELRKEKG